MRRHLKGSIGLCVLGVIAIPTLAVPTTGPADLGLSSQAPNKIIKGANVPILGYVYNVAPAGSSDLNYGIYYVLPDDSLTTTVNGTKAADGGAAADSYQYDFDSTNAPFGANKFTIHASGAVGTLHSPQAQQLTVNVLNHVVPAMWIQGVEVDIRDVAVPEPDIEPLAFGATGGGESFAARAPHILGDPLVPTAAIDLDSILSEGDSQITSDLVTSSNVTADDDPAAGIAWNVFVDGSAPGHYSKILTLLFSDEDIPGAVPTASISAHLEIFADVTASGVTGGLRVLPEPSVSLLLGSLLMPLLGRSRSGRRLPMGA